MVDLVGPREAELPKYEFQHLEVVVLLVADHVDELVGLEVVVAQQGGPEVLGHVYAGAVATEQELLVQPVARKVAPHRTVVLAVHHSEVEPLLHQLFAEQIGLRLIVYLVEVDAKAVVGLVEAGIDPPVHGLPQAAHLRVAFLPAFEHLLGLDHEGGFALGLLLVHTVVGELLDLFFIVLVELHIVFAHKVVAFHSGRFGGLPVAVALPGEHTLADMDAAVVDEVHHLHIGPSGREQLAHRPPQQVVAYMPQVERLVGVRAAVFYHHGLGVLVGRCQAERALPCPVVQEGKPVAVGNLQVEEPFDRVERRHLRQPRLQCGTDLVAHCLGALAGLFHVREHHEGVVAFEFAPRTLQRDVGRR